MLAPDIMRPWSRTRRRGLPEKTTVTVAQGFCDSGWGGLGEAASRQSEDARRNLEEDDVIHLHIRTPIRAHFIR